MFLLFFLWESPIQDRHPNHFTGLQHLVKRHRLHSVQQLQAQQKMTSPQQIERLRELKNVLRLKESMEHYLAVHLQIWFGAVLRFRQRYVLLPWPDLWSVFGVIQIPKYP